MSQVPVFDHTTAIREDCIASFYGVLDPLFETLKQGKRNGV